MKLSFKVHKNIDLVFDYLTNMQKFVSVHPVIYKMEHIANHKYLVYETLRMGFIPFSFTYPVTIEKSHSDFSITMSARVFRITNIEMKFVLTAENDYTIVEEEIKFKSLLPVKYMMEAIFKKQHAQLFKNIEMK